MQSPLMMWARGYVGLVIRHKNKDEAADGDQSRHSIELFLNEALRQSIDIWDIRVQPNGHAEIKVALQDFFRLRPLLRRTSCLLHIKSRQGLPFQLQKLLKRKVFIGGIALFAVMLYVLTSLVWQVHISGNDKIPTAVIREAAAKQGIYRFQWKAKLGELSELSRKLQSALPDTAWVGIEIQGTHVNIRVVEASKPDSKPLVSPRHLIATKNALVTEILAKKGKPLVKTNTYVRKGDILISGFIGNENNSQVVVADGTVKGIVWYTSVIESPLMRTYKVLTGETKSRGYLVIGTRALKLSGYGKVPFTRYETNMQRKVLQWRNFILPIGWMNEKLMEMEFVEQPIDLKQAKEIGLVRARTELLASAGPDARIVSEKILHEKTENGKVYMEVHFGVEELIAQEQPIVMQGE